MMKKLSKRWKDFKKRRKEELIHRAIAAEGVARPGMFAMGGGNRPGISGSNIAGGGQNAGLASTGEKRTYKMKKGIKSK